ncbi:cupin domain-containing protein [Pontibacter cellulosilyticus]|uniref:Cupin domain-containing protein n=1 Tax=Pontibacter cellulosilyticus TaxID=1720253 RepID=A0A923N735_9BACT|nr:cupin domain-containing protein [Pontibacter cellulosilyticus]MBC5993394.1 cupin domain-containing protein [Pontibacter cellulosilyticus]
MKNLLKSAAILSFTLLTVTAWAGDPGDGCASKNTGQSFSQLLDNNSMRLWEIELKPGQFADVHAHPGQKAYAATSGTLKITTSEGKTEEIKVRAGDLLWTDATKYKTVNMGSEAFKAVVYEEKAEQIQSAKNFYSFFSQN